ncbi:hypothetical protein COO60DRAFT_530512 [Scenedesmus sp. NREL 46B-D3]|nr:hypothetical protein COO60DRAFT_530512 [Scenedesmus sp. NREL 46B-D3]
MSAISRQGTLLAVLVAIIAGSIAASAALLPDLIRWDPVRQVWVDMKTKGVVTVTSNSVTNPAPGTAVAAAPTYTQQGETRPQRWSDKSLFPLVIPDAEWFQTCGRIQDDPLTHIASKCDLFKDVVNCQQLAEMGYLPAGVQSFVPGGNLNGGFQLPNGCSSGNLGVEYDGLKMVFNSPQIPILAVIAKDLPLSKVFYFGSGVTQGRLMKIIMLKAEFCYAPPNISPLYVSKSATYSTGMQPGTAAWSFFKTVALAPPFTNNVAAMFKGDSADATWTLNVQKTGTDTVYQGAVNGQITITNPQNAPVTVYNINDYVQGGPQSTVSCGSPVPFQLQPCSSTVCNYVGYWPAAPAPGSYTNLADVQYSVGDTAIMGNQVGTAIFQVDQLSAAVGTINTAAGAIPAGQAVVQDGMAPQAYGFSGTSQQSYSSQLTCPDTAILTNQAVLTASTGQQITQTATVQKLCYELAVRIAQTSAPYVGRWEWTVNKVASAQNVTLKPAETAWDRYVDQQLSLAQAAGQDTATAMDAITGGQNLTSLTADAMPGSTNEEVTYTVTFRRSAPEAATGTTAAFQSMGEVYVTNSSPLNAQLQEVQVSMTNPFGGLPYTTAASCPMLTVAAGQTLTCRYIATPSFNPVGASVAASAIYQNNRNGVPTGATTAFTSASIIVGAAVGAAGASRRLQASTSGEGRGDNTLANVLSNLLKPAPEGTTTTTSLSINRLPPIPIPNLPDMPNISSIIRPFGGNASRSGPGSSAGFNLSKFMSDVAKNLAEDDKESRNTDEDVEISITPKGSDDGDDSDVDDEAPAATPAPEPEPAPAPAPAPGHLTLLLQQQQLATPARHPRCLWHLS